MHLHKNIKNPLYSAFQYSGFSIKLQLLNVFQAENETRTHDPFITSEVLYRLSYSSLWNDKCIKIYTLIRHKRYFKL